ncbi:MAG: YqaJ viral recombinase family protein, partial [Pyrinomonadaceae bacterium]
MQPKSLAWKYEWRAKIGGSRSAAAAGVHEYMTPLQLYKSMVDGAEFDPEENPDMLRGVLMEPIALQRLKMMYADLYFEPHDQDSFVYNEKYPFASDLPDGWVAHDGARIPIQIKVPRPENWRKLDEHIPAYIQCNCIHSCALNNSPAILLACLNPVTMEVYRNVYEPAQDVTQALMDAEERFFTEHVIPRVPPPPRTAGDMRMLWPEHAPGKRVTATNDIAGAHAKLLRLKPEAKERVDRIESLNLMIKAF